MPRRRRRVVHTERFAAIKSLRVAFVKAAALQKATLLDVGANAGDFVDGMMSDLAKASAAAHVRPIMWEPQMSFAPTLLALAARWSGELIPAAASSRAGSQTIYLHGERCGAGTTCFNPESASLLPTPDVDAATVKAGIKTSGPRFNVSAAGGVVATMDFAKYLLQNLSLAIARVGHVVPPVPAFVKLDVEGAEYSLIPHLLTSRALCGRVGFLLVEWHLIKLPRPKRRAGLALRDALQPILNASCVPLGFEPPRVVHDVVPENNLQVDVMGSGCRAYCYNNRYCTRSDCAGCARCHTVGSDEVRRLVTKYMRSPRRRRRGAGETPEVASTSKARHTQVL